MIYLTLFFEFFKIGSFCFGGAFGMIPLIRDTVLSHAWMSESDFYSLVGICESTPGPIAVNMATYVGATQGGLLGGVIATLGVVLPSFLIILLIAALLKNLTKNPFVKSFLEGVKPVIVALILFTGGSLLLKALKLLPVVSASIDLASAIVFSLLAGFYFGGKRLAKKTLSAPALILCSAVLGVAVCTLLDFCAA